MRKIIRSIMEIANLETKSVLLEMEIEEKIEKLGKLFASKENWENKSKFNKMMKKEFQRKENDNDSR